VTVGRPIAPGLAPLRRPVPGQPNTLPSPPQVAESGDPFAELRILRLVARLERGSPQRIDDVTDRLNATYIDWQFSSRVVTDALIALAAAWMADYRNVAGILLEDGPYGATVRIEDSPRVDPWFVLRDEALIAGCEAILADFARRDRVTGDG
jgi:hypothetical protein